MGSLSVHNVKMLCDVKHLQRIRIILMLIVQLWGQNSQPIRFHSGLGYLVLHRWNGNQTIKYMSCCSMFIVIVYDKTQKMTIACHFIALLMAICSDSLHESHSFSVTIVKDATKLSRTELLYKWAAMLCKNTIYASCKIWHVKHCTFIE